MATFARHGGKGEHIMEGINSRMDGLQATILNVKLPYLLAWTDARRRVAARYDELLNGVGDIVTPKVAPDRDHVYHLYVIRTEKRDALRKDLTNAGIATVLNYPKALPFYPAYAYLGHAPGEFPVAHANQSRILSLPIYPEMTEEVIAYITERIASFCQKSKSSFEAEAQLAERPD
jgi:dTDP-4-amino-4,6-dideoxygalactose transaminase